MNKTIGRVLGPLGPLFLIFALLAYLFITGTFNWIVISQLVIGVVCLVAYVVTALDDLRNLATGRGTVFLVTNAIGLVAVVGILAGVNFKAYKSGKEWDLTKAGIHTLADQTQSLVKGLDDKSKVKVYAFYQTNEPGQQQLDEMLRRYKALNPDHFEYEFVDQMREAAMAKEYNISQSGPRIIFKSANGKESRAKDPSEESLTNALSELSRGAEKKIYFVTGHGERSIEDDKTNLGIKLLVDQFKNDGLRTDSISLLSIEAVPADAACLIIAGPRSQYMEGEVDIIRKYVDSGGRLALFLDPGSNSGLETMARGWGADFMQGLIIDVNTRNPLVAIGVPSDQNHPVSKAAISGMQMVASLFPDARGVRKGSVDGYTITDLYKTMPNKSWSEADPLDAGGAMPQPNGANDVMGPIPLGLGISKKFDGDKEMRVVVFGDSDFVSNQYIAQPVGNRDLALNIVQWLVGQESKITIRPKQREKSTITMLTEDKVMLLTFGSLNLLPLLLIGVGLSVWSLRRSK